MRFFFYFNDRGQENGGLAFCLAIDRGKCYNKIIKCMRLHIFALPFSKSLEVLYLKGINNHRRKPM